LTLASSSIEFPSGAGGLPTLRLTCTFTVPLTQAATSIAFADHSYSERIGWREIVVNGNGVALKDDLSEYAKSISNRLTAYPPDMLSNPLDQRQISFDVDLTAASASSSQTVAQQAVPLTSNRNDAFTQLITLKNLTLPTILFAIVVAFIWGGMHAMTPGHGKTIVAAYLVGSRGTAKHALYLGLTTTITHTAGVFALGLVTLLASEYIVPERLFPWLSLLSGLLVAGIGLSLFFSRLRGARIFGSSIPEHKHDHSHEHEHAQDHDHHHGDYHQHADHHEHDHSSQHSHLPPGADGSPVTWRSLLGLGISGGILPCPSALVVLLSAIALNRVAFGLLLVLVFSLGLAGALTTVGLLLVYARRFFDRVTMESRLIRLLPAVSALIVMAAGLGVTVQALTQLGILHV